MRCSPLWLTVLGCSSSAVYLPWPEPGAEDASYVLFYYDGAERRALAAVRGGRVDLDVAFGSPVRAWVYAESLAALGLVEGPVALRAECRACALLEPVNVWQSDGQSWAVGASEDAEADALVHDRRTRCDFCAPLTPILGSLPGSRRVYFAERIDPTHVVIGTDTGLFIVDYDSRVEPICTTTTRFFDGHYDGRDLWLHDASSLSRLDLVAQRALGGLAPCATEAMAATSTSGEVPAHHWIDGSRDAFPTELYVTNESGRIGHYDSEGWRWIDRAPAGGQLGGVLWLGPGRAITVNDTPNINRVEGDTVRRETSPPLPIGPPDVSFVMRSERLGIVLGTRNAGVLLEGPQGWENSKESGVVVAAIADWDEGLLLSSRGLIFGQYSRRTGHCDTYLPLIPDDQDITATEVVSLGDRVFVGDVTNQTTPAGIAVLQRSGPRCE